MLPICATISNDREMVAAHGIIALDVICVENAADVFMPLPLPNDVNDLGTSRGVVGHVASLQSTSDIG